MPVAESIRHVPWTCRWGRFGGPITRVIDAPPGFLFWICDHPAVGQGHLSRALERDQCAHCRHWERADEIR